MKTVRQIAIGLCCFVPVLAVHGQPNQSRGDFAAGVAREDGGWWIQNGAARVRVSDLDGATVARVASADRRSLVATVNPRETRVQVLEVDAESGAVRTLASPDLDNATVVSEPSFVVDSGGSLLELLWLAGEAAHQTAVMASTWDGTAWREPVTVSPVGPGTQISLSSCRLSTGEGLAVWAAFDGHDDEVTWSRGGAGRWSEPAALTANQVPDILPDLICSGGGAFAVWSWYDGNDYRLVTSRFDGQRWSPSQSFGPKGAAGATFVDRQPLRIVYRQALPRGWGSAELDPAGIAIRMVEVESNEIEMPRLIEISRDEIAFEWRSEESRRAVWGSPSS